MSENVYHFMKQRLNLKMYVYDKFNFVWLALIYVKCKYITRRGSSLERKKYCFKIIQLKPFSVAKSELFKFSDWCKERLPDQRWLYSRNMFIKKLIWDWIPVI